MVKVSIVIPVYNVENYITTALNSVIKQILYDIEIICIDDASTDKSAEIIKKFASTDKRIKLIQLMENVGVSAARNTGLGIASGEYIGFLDPDDFVDHDFYKKLYDLAILEDADIAKAELLTHEINGQIRPSNLNDKIREFKFKFRYHFVSAIYKSEFLKRNDIKFSENLTAGEDILFLANAVLNTDKIALTDNTFYHYVRRDGSLDSKKISEKSAKSSIISRLEILKLYNKSNIDKNQYLWVAFDLLNTSMTYVAVRKDFDTKDEHRLLQWIVDETMQMFKLVKYKEIVPSNLLENIPYAKYLISGDKEGLYNYVVAERKQLRNG